MEEEVCELLRPKGPTASPPRIGDHLDTAATAKSPPDRRTRRASCKALRRSAASCRWYRGPSSSATSAEPSYRPRARASPTAAEAPASRVGPGLLDVQGHRVTQVYLVTERGEPQGVHPGPAAHVHDGGGRADDALAPHGFQRRPAARGVEPVAFLARS